MQAALYSWALYVACAAVATAMFVILLTNGEMKKFGRV